MKILWGIAIVWALYYGLGSLDSPRHAPFLWPVIALAPLALLFWAKLQTAKANNAGHTAILKESGVAQGLGFDHTEGGTGIAINKEAQTLTLHAGGHSKTYAYADVRNWESVKERAGEVVGVAGFAGIAALASNSRAKKEAEANTGFFVTVRDVDNPIWRIEMKDKGMQARWMEILRQEINER